MTERLLLAVLVFLLWAPASASAADGVISQAHRDSIGTWTLSYDILADKKGYCRLGRNWPGGSSVEFVSFGPKQAPVISIVNPAWNIAENAKETVGLEADATDKRTLVLQRLSPRQAILSQAADIVTWALDRFAAGKVIAIVFANGERISLDPAEGAAVRQKFNACAGAWAGEIAAPNLDGSPKSAANGGSGFALSYDGIIITNAHVVAGCPAIVVTSGGRGIPADVLALDASDDLAAIRAKGLTFMRIAALRPQDPVAIGAKAVTYGFPLYGALSTDGTFTIGYISALKGMRDDNRYLQISTPVQPGNSGGPLLDSRGTLVGVVAGKLDAVKMEKIARAIPENVNFAVTARTLASFLQANSIPFSLSETSGEKTDVDLATIAQGIAVHIGCRG